MTIFLLASMASNAQDIGLGPLHSSDSPRENWLLPGDTVKTATDTIVYGGKPQELHYSVEPYRPGSEFGLHEGFNASLSASAFATFGSHAPHKGGFGESLNVAYLKPLTRNNNLWLLAGGYVNHINYGGDNLHDGGFFAMLNWQINQHWSVYAYGQLSVSNNFERAYRPYGLYSPYYYPYGFLAPVNSWNGMGMPGANVIGAGVQYKPNPSVSINVNVEGVWYDNRHPVYFDRYNYPTPKD
ncbi:MAG: hypothetical protein PUI88_03745 [Prevotella sp.]|nr:hypothetical protein [Prevotella sp.]